MTPDEWSDEVYEATGMVVTREHAKAIGQLVAARVREVEAERDRLREALRIADDACRTYWGWEYGRPGDVDNNDVPDSSLLVKWRRNYEARAALGEARCDCGLTTVEDCATRPDRHCGSISE